MLLNDLQFVDKDTFIEYYNRCMGLGINPCEDAEFIIGKHKNIGIKLIIDTRDFRIPDFVSTIVQSRSFPVYLKDSIAINLNNVTSIMNDGLYNSPFDELYSEKLLCLGGGSLRGSYRLEKVCFPNLKIVGPMSMSFCSKLKEVYIPSAERILNQAFYYSSVEKLIINSNTYLKDIRLDPSKIVYENSRV